MTTSRRSAEVRLERVDIYRPENPHEFDFSELKTFLQSHFSSLKVTLRPPVLATKAKAGKEPLALSLARARVKDPSSNVQEFEPMLGEVDYETRSLSGKVRVGGVVYDGRRLEDICMAAVGVSPIRSIASIVLTDRLVSTFSTDDLRHHLRTIVCGFPSIVSLPGIVEAPAKPREYYVMKRKLELEGGRKLDLELLKREFRGRFVDYDDPAMLEVLKGLALQAVLFHLTLAPFCDDRRCRLFNAHWQDDLIRSQLRPRGLCRRHSRQIKSLSERPVVAWAHP